MAANSKSRIIFVRLLCSRAFSTALGVALILGLSSGTAWASDRDEAKRHFEAGKRLTELEDFSSAATEFELSVRLHPTKTALFNLANCYKAMHRYDKALEIYDRLLSEFGDQLDAEMKGPVEADIASLRSIIGQLTINVDVDGATLKVNGRVVGVSPLKKPVILSPGEYEVIVEHAEYKPQKRKVVMVAGEKIDSSFVMVEKTEAASQGTKPKAGTAPADGTGTRSAMAAIAPPPESQTPEARPEAPVPPSMGPPPQAPKKKTLSGLFWGGLAGTVVVGAVSGVFWGLSASRKSDFETERDTFNDTGDQDDWQEMKWSADAAEGFNKAAIGTAIGAGALLAATVAVLAIDLSKDETPETEPVKASAVPGGIAVHF